MKIDKKTVDLLLSLDDDRLWQTIGAVAAASGVKGIAAMERPRDLSKLRAVLSTLTESDIARALALIGGKGAPEK